ncbi:sensor histidine kinase [Streptomyces xanthophaeus]|uniref:sensor histidine kinase n=1 Tax=Streptomyces xanthophaeus TaxID=67385 RepID=UPI0036579FF7
MRHIHRTRRDWAADLGLLLFAACFAAVSSQSIPVPDTLGPAWRAADQAAGGLACAAVLLRRRWPVQLAVVLLLAGSQAHYLTGPALVAVFTVAASRPWRVTAWVAALAFAPLPVFLWQLPETSEDRAGALEYNPGAPQEEIARAAGVIRESAHLALHDLREVVGVLRADTAAGQDHDRPQPELADLERLVAEARAAGGRIELTVPTGGSAPPALTGRTAYRIVQEALTNVRKHAPGSAVTVRVAGAPGERLTVEVTNTRPPGPGPAGGAGEGGGQGLIGLAERARLAGGELTSGPADGGFRVHAWLPWQS